jgi:predicted secreted protein
MGSACHDGASLSANSGTPLASSSASASSPPADANASAANATNATGATAAAADSAQADAGPVVVTAEDEGKTFDLAVGAPLVFSLASHAGTGFVWMPTQLDATLLAQDGARSSESDSDVPGAPKRDVYRFIAKSPGTTTVEMSLKRPFGTAPTGRTLHVTLRIH